MFDTNVTVTGWLGTDVTVRRAGEHCVASFRVATRPRRFRDGKWHDGATTWYQITAWRQLAEHANDSLHSGDPVVVTGRLTAELWTRPDGTSATRHVVVATAIGHNLSHGTSQFARRPPADQEPEGRESSRGDELVELRAADRGSAGPVPAAPGCGAEALAP